MHFSSCLKALQERIDIIKSLKAISFNDSVIKIRIQGTDHNLVIDLIKLFDWVSVEKISPESSKEVEEDAVDLSKPAQFKILNLNSFKSSHFTYYFIRQSNC